MIRSFSERLMPPYSGQVQVAESQTYRALTIDGEVWEIQYVNRSHVRVATLSAADIKKYAANPELLENDNRDEKLVELLQYLVQAQLPFTGKDHFEYWLLDAADQTPLALIFSCTEESQIEKFPARAEWTALPAAVMPVEKTDAEIADQLPPVNYRVERMVAERAGTNPKASWFDRREQHDCHFPSLMVKEDWTDPGESELCQRYLQRQAPRLLMLHGLNNADRTRLEASCRPQAMEVARFHTLYPEIVDDNLIKSLRVEAKLRAATGTHSHGAVHNRRDGVLYI